MTVPSHVVTKHASVSKGTPLLANDRVSLQLNMLVGPTLMSAGEHNFPYFHNFQNISRILDIPLVCVIVNVVLKAAGAGRHLSSIVYFVISKMDRNEYHRTGVHEADFIQSFSDEPILLGGEDAINYPGSSRSAGVEVHVCSISVLFVQRTPHDRKRCGPHA